MRSDRLKHVLAAAGCALVAWAGSVFALESVCRWAESHSNVYLWWWEEWLQLFTPANYVDRGEGRVFLCGASEMREGFLVDELDARLPDAEPYQEAFSYATLQSVRLRLEFIEAVHGATAMPDAVVLGFTPRLMLNHPPVADVPAVQAIADYSANVAVDTDASPPVFVEKGLVEGLVARFRLLTRQSGRYRAGALAGLLYLTSAKHRESLGVDSRLRPPKWHKLKELDKTRYPAVAAEMKRTWRRKLPVKDLRHDLRAIQDLCDRHGILLVGVDMPEASWMRSAYPEEFRRQYREEVRAALGDTPWLDLSELLTDYDFFDWAHPKRVGALKITEKVADFLETHR